MHVELHPEDFKHGAPMCSSIEYKRSGEVMIGDWDEEAGSKRLVPEPLSVICRSEFILPKCLGNYPYTRLTCLFQCSQRTNVPAREDVMLWHCTDCTNALRSTQLPAGQREASQDGHLKNVTC